MPATRTSIAWDRNALLREIFDTLRTGIKYGTFVAFAYFGWRSVASLAGQTSTANLRLAFNAAVDLGHEVWPAWLVAAVCTSWALLERQLRRRKTAYLTGRIQELEVRLDPQRESSFLPPDGNTRAEDRP